MNKNIFAALDSDEEVEQKKPVDQKKPKAATDAPKKQDQPKSTIEKVQDKPVAKDKKPFNKSEQQNRPYKPFEAKANDDGEKGPRNDKAARGKPQKPKDKVTDEPHPLDKHSGTGIG